MKNILEIVKKNLVSIICGIVAIGAVVALFVPIGGYFQTLKQEADSRSADYSQLKNLLGHERQLPQIALEDTERKKLDKFPTQPVIDYGAKLVEQLKSESSAVFDAAVKMNQHQPLVPDALPDGGTGAFYRFRDLYRQTINLSVADNRRTSYLVQMIHGGFRPSEAEITDEKERLTKEIRAGLVADPAGGAAFNADAVQAQLDNRIPKVADELRRRVAESSQVYVEYNAFDPYTSIMTINGAPEAWQIFAAQMGLWVQEDVCRSIASANNGSKNVMESAVKHLVKISLPPAMFQALFPGQISSVSAADPSSSQTLTKVYKTTPTGRASNGIYDVIPFRILMEVDGEKIPLILQELSRGKFITVTQCNINVLDAAQKELGGYYYGESKPLVELNLSCEAMMMRQWTAPLMPQGTRRALGIPDPPAAAAK